MKEQTLTAGITISHYRILSKIGAGGMGEVYLAHDVRLGRQVALKILPAEFAEDKKRMGRFEQEARAASSLNHPNIITIHEIGEADAHNFIVTEFVDGVTLRQRMKSAPLELIEALEIAAQSAAALAAAHGAGIIHRDIKPENIMLRHDRIVKVLDFGLAKVAEKAGGRVDPESPTRAHVNTQTGVVMGTTYYMSPEQSRGFAVDVRTDIWSLGCVLYEMVTNRAPFEGDTQSDVIAAILKTDPPPLTGFLREAPAELQRIVTKALAKDREERYQTIKDMALDLRRLKQELEFEAKLERSASTPRALDSAGSRQEDAETQIDYPEETAETGRPVATAQSTSGGVERHASWIHRHKKMVAAAVGLLFLAGLAYLILTSGVVRFGSSRRAINSVAIMPLVNTGKDPETEYLSDGITESIINSLSQLSQLKVTARTTVFRYKGREVDPQNMGRELGVDALLTGRVQQHGDTLTIQVDLVSTADGSQLWGERYNRKLADIFSVQEEIARQITDRMRFHLTGEEQKRVTKRYTDNIEAYQLYLKGRYHTERRGQEGVKKAIEYFNQAIAKDPNYALAYAGLADAYGPLAYYSYLHPKETQPKSQAAARKAVELDYSLAEAHAVLAAALFFQNKDWRTAEKEFLRAIELNPNYSDPHTFYANVLAVTGREEQAIEEAKRGLALDPLSPLKSSVVAEILYYMRRYDEAVAQGRGTVEMNPDAFDAHVDLGQAYVGKKMYPEAIAAFQKALPLSGNSPYVSGFLGHAYAAAGNRSEAVKILNELKEAAKERYVSAYHIALIHAGLGDLEQAFDWLEKAYEERNEPMVWMGLDPKLDGLRSDPRFADIMRRMGLPQ